MRGVCGQCKTDAYAWAAADTKPTPMRGPRSTQIFFFFLKLNQYMRPFRVQCKSCVGFYSFWPTRVASANGRHKNLEAKSSFSCSEHLFFLILHLPSKKLLILFPGIIDINLVITFSLSNYTTQT